MSLQTYDFILRDRPGDEDPAGIWTRYPVQTPENKSTHESRVTDEEVNVIMDHTVHKAMTLQEIAQETKENQPL